jgi:hypothetical protein
MDTNATPSIWQTIWNRATGRRNASASTRPPASDGFIRIGSASGVLSRYADKFTPDEDLTSGLLDDADRHHFHGFGLTGSGMTCGVIRPIAKQWVNEPWKAKRKKGRGER